MALSLLGSDAAQSHTLIDRTIIPDNRSLPDHDPASMIDQDPMAQLRARMNLDQCKKAGHLGNPSGNEKHVMLIKPMGKPVPDECMNSLI